MRLALVLMAAGAIAAAAFAQTATKPASAPTSAAAETKPANDFAALAAKAKTFGAIHAKGYFTVKIAAGEDRPAPKIEIEIWTDGPAMKSIIRGPGMTEYRVSDGKTAYVYIQKGDESAGRRKTIRPAEYYDLLSVGAALADAADGYANLAAIAKIAPAPAEDGLGKDLAWFALQAAGGTPSKFLTEGRTVKLAISPADGLARAVIGTTKDRSQVLVYETVEKASSPDLKLPPEAAKAAWRDDDSAKNIPAPADIINKS